jgi:signal peptidase
MNSKWLDTATSAMKAGERRRALSLVRAYVLHHPADDEGWYRLGLLSKMPEFEIARLQRRLAAAPYYLRTPRANRPEEPVEAPTKCIAPAAHTLPQNEHLETPHRPGRQLPLSGLINTAFCGAAGVALLILLAAVFPMFMGYRSLTIISESMEPAIHTGAVAVAEPVASNSLVVGDVIVYAPGATAQVPIVHRIIDFRDEEGVRYFTTRGDANGDADAEVMLPATAWRVVYSLPLAGYLVTFATSRTGVILFIVVPALALALLSLREWLGKRKRGAAPARAQEAPAA